MKLTLNFEPNQSTTELQVFGCFNKTVEKKKNAKEAGKELVTSHWPTEIKEAFDMLVARKHFKAEIGEHLTLTLLNGQTAIICGLGDKTKLTTEVLRKQVAILVKAICNKYEDATIHLDGFTIKGHTEESLVAISEAIYLTNYTFDRHLSHKKTHKLAEIQLATTEKKTVAKKYESILANTKTVCECISVAKNFVNEAPNHLNSETYAKEIEKDAKTLKNVKIKVLGKAELKKENMGMFLSVNAGSAFEPKLVHLTYTPSKANSKTRHIALVGKGLTFDTGGYSLKSGPNMMGMKFDMAGSATVYAAFRAAVMLQLPVKISCFLGMTDNAVNSLATMPDSIG